MIDPKARLDQAVDAAFGEQIRLLYSVLCTGMEDGDIAGAKSRFIIGLNIVITAYDFITNDLKFPTPP